VKWRSCNPYPLGLEEVREPRPTRAPGEDTLGPEEQSVAFSTHLGEYAGGTGALYCDGDAVQQNSEICPCDGVTERPSKEGRIGRVGGSRAVMPDLPGRPPCDVDGCVRILGPRSQEGDVIDHALLGQVDTYALVAG